MILEGCSTEPPDDPCPWLWETAQAILDAAYDGAEAVVGPPGSGCVDPLDSYVSLSRPVAEHYDAVSVYLASLDMTPDSRRAKAELSGCGDRLHPRWSAAWVVSVWLNGYPVAREVEGRLTVPTPEALGLANQWVYAVGHAAYQEVSRRQVTGELEVPEAIDRVTLGPLTPLGPLGGAAGWSFQVVSETR